MGRIARQPVEVRDRNHARAAVRSYCFDLRIEHPHRDRHIARMGGDAGVAGADDGMHAAESIQRTAATARLALVAGLVGVVKVGAAGPLQQVPCRRRLVAQLTRCAGQQGTRQHRVVAPHARVRGQVGVAHQRTDAQAAVGHRLDPVQREVVHVDQVGGRLDLELHQVQQVGAARNEARTGNARCGRCRFRGRRGPLIGKRLHRVTPATSAIASWMLE
jgi:hypothetical protein